MGFHVVSVFFVTGTKVSNSEKQMNISDPFGEIEKVRGSLCCHPLIDDIEEFVCRDIICGLIDL